jgi:hypothetical protein
VYAADYRIGDLTDSVTCRGQPEPGIRVRRQRARSEGDKMNSDDLCRAVRLWIGYLRLARLSNRPEVRNALKKSADFYQRWDDFEDEPFETWWETHSYMFEDKIASVRPEDDTIPCPSENELLLFIPLRRKPTELVNEVRALITEQQKKVKRTQRSPIQDLAEGKSPQIDQLAYKLAIGSVVYEFPKLRGRPRLLLDQVHAYFKNSGQEVPMTLWCENEDALLRALRNLDRYVKGADQVMLNVANGRFPGRMTKDTQVS